MALCSTACAEQYGVPTPLDSSICFPQTRNGGISHIIFASCDVQFTNVTDCVEWFNLQADGRVGATLEVLGQKPRGTATRKRVSSCRGEQVTGFEYTVTFQDYNADNDTFTDYDFWNQIQMYYSAYHVGFLTCDGYLIGFEPVSPGNNRGSLISNFTVEVANVIEDDVNGSSFWEGTITWKAKYEHKPILVNGILNALKGVSACVVSS